LASTVQSWPVPLQSSMGIAYESDGGRRARGPVTPRGVASHNTAVSGSAHYVRSTEARRSRVRGR
jgi:hypothetical protein